MTCFGECTETPEGGVCEECPDGFEGDGHSCTDIRVFCANLTCPEGCQDSDVGGECITCPEFHEPIGENATCVDVRIYCQEKIHGTKQRFRIPFPFLILDNDFDRVSRHASRESIAQTSWRAPHAESAHSDIPEMGSPVHRLANKPFLIYKLKLMINQ